jgi:hypothetical protein
VDGQVASEYVTLYGDAVIVSDERVTELTWPLLLAYITRRKPRPGGTGSTPTAPG